MKAQMGSTGIAATSINIRTGWGLVANANPRIFNPPETILVLLVREMGWAAGPVSTDVGKRKSLAPIRVRTLNRPACRKSLYRLNHPGPHIHTSVTKMQTK